jgi:hypothetical protein
VKPAPHLHIIPKLRMFKVYKVVAAPIQLRDVEFWTDKIFGVDDNTGIWCRIFKICEGLK